MGKDAPEAPDPAASARAQARANRINQVTPFGSMRFFGPGQTIPQNLISGTTSGSAPLVTQPVGQPQPVATSPNAAVLNALLSDAPRDTAAEVARFNQLREQQQALPSPQQAAAGGGTPGTVAQRATAVSTLSPELQQILDQQQELQTTLGQRGIEQAAGLPDPNAPVFSDLPPLDVDPAARDRIEQAQFDRVMSLLNPQFERREERQLQRLANQGLPQASRAFRTERGDFIEERSRAEEQAALASVLAGEDALQRQFGRQLQARQQLGGEQLTERQVPLNEVMSLLGLQQVRQPQFFGPGQVDVLGAQQQQLAAQNAAFNARQGLFGGLLGLGGQLGAAALLA